MILSCCMHVHRVNFMCFVKSIVITSCHAGAMFGVSSMLAWSTSCESHMVNDGCFQNYLNMNEFGSEHA